MANLREQFRPLSTAPKPSELILLASGLLILATVPFSYLTGQFSFEWWAVVRGVYALGVLLFILNR